MKGDWELDLPYRSLELFQFVEPDVEDSETGEKEVGAYVVQVVVRYIQDSKARKPDDVVIYSVQPAFRGDQNRRRKIIRKADYVRAPIVAQVCDSEVFQRGNLGRNTPQAAAFQVQYTCPLGSSNL